MKTEAKTEMKILTTVQESILESSQERTEISFGDVLVYDEMADQSYSHFNVLEQIKQQMSQLQEMSARRQFLTKEIMAYITKD